MQADKNKKGRIRFEGKQKMEVCDKESTIVPLYYVLNRASFHVLILLYRTNDVTYFRGRGGKRVICTVFHGEERNI